MMHINMVCFSTIYIFMLSFITSTNGSKFLAYSEPEYAGTANKCPYDEDSCDVSEVISIKIHSGTCGQILNSATGQVFFITEDIPDTDYYYSGRMSSCPTHHKTIECPVGTFVKHIEWHRESNLTKGIILRCNKPNSILTEEAFPLFSVSSSSVPPSSEMNVTKCPVITKLTIATNMSQEIDGDILLDENCAIIDRPASTKKLQCPPFTAISGMNFKIETKTNFIKQTGLICSEIANIANICKTEEKRQPLLPSSPNSIIKTVGLGIKPTLSESEVSEFLFYRNFPLERGFALSTNFKNNIGKSSQTNYDWKIAPKSTWQSEQNITIEIESSTGCETKIYEIVGTCSYMVVRPFYLEREDNCSGRSFKTTEVIPSHNLQKRSYKSEIPQSVKNLFK